MSDTPYPLVERLRMLGPSHECDPLMHEAADEIERLRAELAEERERYDALSAYMVQVLAENKALKEAPPAVQSAQALFVGPT